MKSSSSPVDPQVWCAIAGDGVRVPAAGFSAYYFPEGHAEQATSPPDLSSLPSLPRMVLCTVTAAELLANCESGEIFVRLILDHNLASNNPELISAYSFSGLGGAKRFEKVLTPSDANNGGGFSVPRGCADTVLPQLDFEGDPPVQTISVKDVHGAPYTFRHIYRGTPRRHLLTTGWSKFVNDKRLVAGDSVTFVRSNSGELFVGVHRCNRSFVPSVNIDNLLQNTNNIGGGGMRNIKGRVPPETVVEAARMAAAGRQFEVMYYPRAGPEFVVPKQAVEAAMRVWLPGMRVKTVVPRDDGSGTNEFQGTLMSLSDVGPLSRSPWRMLQVTWDEQEVLKTMKSVNPWQVEAVSAITHLKTAYPALKKLRLTENTEIVGDGVIFPMRAFAAPSIPKEIVGSSTLSFYNYHIIPAGGMQGARHDSLCVPNMHNILQKNFFATYPDNANAGNSQEEGLLNVSTDLHVGSSLQEGNSSSQSQGSVRSPVRDPTKKENGTSIILFGQIVHIEKPEDANADTETQSHSDDSGQVFLSKRAAASVPALLVQ